MTDLQRLFLVPALSLRTKEILANRHHVMMCWHSLASKTKDKRSTAYKNWQRCVDRFFEETDGCIYLMGRNVLDHGRRKESA